MFRVGQVAPGLNGAVFSSSKFRIEGCNDFEQCARHFTTFDDDIDGVEKTHYDFMKGRTFRIKFVKDGIWLNGKVRHWGEFTGAMGFTDIDLQWVLVADFEAPSEVAPGTIVSGLEKFMELENVEELDNTDKYKLGLCIVREVNADDGKCIAAPFCSKKLVRASLDDVEPFAATRINLFIHRMNVQGGGTVSAPASNVLLPIELCSFEWTAPFLDESYHLPSPDTFPLVTLSATEHEQLLQRKADLLKTLRQQMQPGQTPQQKMDTVMKVYVPGFEANELLCLPFVLYGVFLRALIKAKFIPGKDLASAKTIVAMALRQVEEDRAQVDDYAFVTEAVAQYFKFPQSASPTELIEHAFYSSLYGVLSPMGEWFELEHYDYRAAIWCYNKAQECAHRAPFPIGGPASLANLIFIDTMNAGVASRRMEDFLSAAKYYEKVFALEPPTPQNRSELLINAKSMQDKAADWIGTSGYFTPWETGQIVTIGPVGDCAACGTANARSKCGSCSLVHYCNRECQKAHWKSTHQYTCLFKKKFDHFSADRIRVPRPDT